MSIILRILGAAILLAPTPLLADAGLKIGVAGPITGPNAAYGKQYVDGVNAAVDRINKNGGVLGRKLQVVLGDDVSDPKQGVSVANNFVADGIKFVVGHFNSGVTIPASDGYADNGVLFVTPTATSDKVTERHLWNAFRACGRNDQQGEVSAKYVLDSLKGKKLAVIDDKSEGGKGVADELRRDYKVGGGAHLVLDERINPGEKDYSAVVSKLKSSGADVLYYGGMHTEAGLLVRQMRDQGVKTVLLGSDGIGNQEFAAIGGPAAEGTLMTSFPDPSSEPRAKQAVEDLAARGAPPEAVTMFAYAATQIIAQGIVGANSVDPRKVADYLHSGAKLDTVLGPISYDKKGDIQQPGFVMFRWTNVDGKIQPKQID